MNQVEQYLDKDKTLIIAEVAQSHDGSLGQCHAFIDAVAKTGADSIKFQTHIADEESTPLEQWRVKFSKQDDSRMDYWRRMEFTEEQWIGLKNHSEEKGLIFISSAFSIKAFELLDKIGTPCWKIASGELTNLPMIELMLRTGKPFLISSGMSEIEEVSNLVNKVKLNGNKYAVFQCTSSYPTPPEKVGLNIIQEYKDLFKCPIGLSDHSGKIFASLAAVTLGASLIEVHATLSKYMFGPDVIASLEIDELSRLVEGVRDIESMLSHPLKKDEVAEGMKTMKGLFNKSVVSSGNFPKGTILTESHLAYKKPGHGISAYQYHDLLGKRINKNINYNHFFEISDFE